MSLIKGDITKLCLNIIEQMFSEDENKMITNFTNYQMQKREEFRCEYRDKLSANIYICNVLQVLCNGKNFVKEIFAVDLIIFLLFLLK